MIEFLLIAKGRSEILFYTGELLKRQSRAQPSDSQGIRSMRHILAGILLSFLQQADARALDGWQVFSPAGAGFTVKLPGEPKKTARALEVPGGTINLTLYGIERNGLVCFISVTECSPGVLKQNANEVLDDARDNGVKKSGGTLREERKIKLNEFPGREMTIDLPDSKLRGGGIFKSRVYLVGRTHYQVAAMSTIANENPNVQRAFLNSFQLKREAATTKDGP
jgi:hypothetical protein